MREVKRLMRGRKSYLRFKNPLGNQPQNQHNIVNYLYKVLGG